MMSCLYILLGKYANRNRNRKQCLYDSCLKMKPLPIRCFLPTFVHICFYNLYIKWNDWQAKKKKKRESHQIVKFWLTVIYMFRALAFNLSVSPPSSCV